MSSKSGGTWPGHLPSISDVDLLMAVSGIEGLSTTELATVVVLCEEAKSGELKGKDRDWLIVIAKKHGAFKKAIAEQTPAQRRFSSSLDTVNYSTRVTAGTKSAEKILAKDNLPKAPPRRPAC